ncbi:S9 family peptidase [Flavobacterium sp. TAB 87]|uniref:alpha/beta hydrolase family protein n=1 Tax=Flavobacterium sp. TAB 87 TaxID=1729581 RepID=UPI0018D23A64|nr:prolyl oligopeptidase family serine peptidase [Flavobacterium sp. TAB 87]
MPLVACPLSGQVVQKKMLSAEQYPLWGNLYFDKLAPSGQWAAFKMVYDTKSDTLFAKNTSNSASYKYPSGRNSIFTKDNLFICQVKKDLHITDLKTGKVEILTSVRQFTYSEPTDYLIVNFSSEKNKDVLLIRKADGSKKMKEVQNVKKISLSPDQQQLLYTSSVNTKQDIVLLNLKSIATEKLLYTIYAGNYSHFTWHKGTKSFAFTIETDNLLNTKLFYYSLQTNDLISFPVKSLQKFTNGAYIANDQSFKILISDDLQKVFFNYKNTTTKSENSLDSNIEIWNANDKMVYLEQKINGSPKMAVKTALWNTSSNTVHPITTVESTEMILSGNQKYAIISDPNAYEPQFESNSPRDYYILDLETFQKHFFLKKHTASIACTIPSPTGKYIAYFRENNWWVYNCKTQKHTNITKNITTKFMGKTESLNPESVYGNPGWCNNDNEILLYDQYDIWAITADGSSFKRLTHGKEINIHYRIADVLNKNSYNVLYSGIKSQNYDLSKSMLLSATGDDGKTGWYEWNNNSKEKCIAYDDTFKDQLFFNQNKQIFFYAEQNFDLSPRLVRKKKDAAPIPYFQSNPQQEKYYWGKSEMIYYHNAKNQLLKGVLFYPANYNPKKKYPMIVHVYELQSYLLHKYQKPSLYNSDGFNPTVFTQEGYFVLYPDIKLEYGKPGISAADCVTAATKKVIDKAIINPGKIGLIGHSFGGYETNFIITQTDLFATAVSGSGIADITAMYLTANLNTGKPDMWRFEKEQWAMGKSPFEDPLIYQNNSPISNATEIKTPLFLWAGKDDKQVDLRQSISYYLALRRLGKKNIMVLYPEETHVISKPINQIDLTNRIKQWFAYYLKEDQSAQWITYGI